MKIFKFENYKDYLGKALSLVEQSLFTDEPIYCGLSGGSTPKDLYAAMNRSAILKLEQIHFYILDERYVSRNSSQSNYKLVQDNLLTELSSENLHDFDCELNREESAVKYESELAKIPGGAFDLAILGIGLDGHFASIFPGFDHFDSLDKVFLTETEKFEIRERLTLSPNFIMKAKKIIVLLKGVEKLAVLEELESGHKWPAEFPAVILDEHEDVTVLYCSDSSTA